MNLSIDIKSFTILTIAFILFTVVGTLSHEYGHIAVAKYLGYDTTLHYGFFRYYPKGLLDDKDYKKLTVLTEDYLDIVYDSWPEDVKDKHQEYSRVLEKRYKDHNSNHHLLILIGGPLQTVLTGTIGLLILFLRKKSIKSHGLKFLDWLAVFLSLFWLRQVFNLATAVLGEIISPDGTWFGGDETGISEGLNLWYGTISIILAVIGLIICLHIIFKTIPKTVRSTFILSGFIGGIAGFILWMNIIGPKLLS